MLARRHGAELAVDQRLQGVGHKRNVPVATAAFVQPAILERAVLVDTARFHIRNPDDDRLHTLVAERFHCLVDLPFAGVAERLVEQILAVLHIEHWVALIGFDRIRWRKIHEKPATVMELWAVNVVGYFKIADHRVRGALIDVTIPGVHGFHIVMLIPALLYHARYLFRLTAC